MTRSRDEAFDDFTDAVLWTLSELVAEEIVARHGGVGASSMTGHPTRDLEAASKSREELPLERIEI
jgi:hypothetical protein